MACSAREMAEAAVNTTVWMTRKAAIDRLTAAIEADRAATIEACAVEAESTACRQRHPMLSNCQHEYCANRREAARRVRALATTPRSGTAAAAAKEGG